MILLWPIIYRQTQHHPIPEIKIQLYILTITLYGTFVFTPSSYILLQPISSWHIPTSALHCTSSSSPCLSFTMKIIYVGREPTYSSFWLSLNFSVWKKKKTFSFTFLQSIVYSLILSCTIGGIIISILSAKLPILQEATSPNK